MPDNPFSVVHTIPVKVERAFFALWLLLTVNNIFVDVPDWDGVSDPLTFPLPGNPSMDAITAALTSILGTPAAVSTIIAGLQKTIKEGTIANTNPAGDDMVISYYQGIIATRSLYKDFLKTFVVYPDGQVCDDVTSITGIVTD